MSLNKTKIDWPFKPEPLLTVNPFFGCSHKSEGCEHCYAEAMAYRLANMDNKDYAAVVTSCKYYGIDVFKPKWNGKTFFKPEVLKDVCERKKPATIFWCSMSDLFHENNDVMDMAYVWYVINNTKHLQHVILTKRPERMMRLSHAVSKTYNITLEKVWSDNVWLGVTAENQNTADDRIYTLLSVPGQHRTFVSVEPMLEEVDLSGYLTKPQWGKVNEQGLRPFEIVGRDDLLNQIIIGAETGPNARPCNPKHIIKLQQQCEFAGVPCYTKNNARKILDKAIQERI